MSCSILSLSSSTPDPRILSSNLMARLHQEGKPDLHLRGSDGVEVPAFRLILACSSNVLDRMLCGNFEESSSNVIALDYHSKVLAAVVKFCITDDVCPFGGRNDHAAIRRMVQLLACAHFLNMPRLHDKAQALVTSLLGAGKSLACAVLDEAFLFCEPTQPIKLHALNIIRNFPEDALLSTHGILNLGAKSLGEIISDEEMVCEEITLFRALHKWAIAETKDIPLGLDLQEDRMSIAKSLATSQIRFVAIRPTDLTNIVRRSGLVEERVIAESLEAHALSAEKELEDRVFSKKRKKTTSPGIRVSGAGTDVANGVYEENGEYGGSPRYTKKCLWKGKERTLVINRSASSGDWYISIMENDGIFGKSSRNDFYAVHGKDGVPADGWKARDLGREPCPKCEKY